METDGDGRLIVEEKSALLEGPFQHVFLVTWTEEHRPVYVGLDVFGHGKSYQVGGHGVDLVDYDEAEVNPLMDLATAVEAFYRVVVAKEDKAGHEHAAAKDVLAALEREADAARAQLGDQCDEFHARGPNEETCPF